MKIISDRPLARESLWSIRSVVAMEPFVAIAIEPGAEFSWKSTYSYYTLPPARSEALAAAPSMNGRQRVLAALRREPVDRAPVCNPTRPEMSISSSVATRR